jgi:type III restriction enzyme
MAAPFFEQPILNSPYAYPTRHWELDADGQPTHTILDYRRGAKFITPVPKPKKQKGNVAQQGALSLDEGAGLTTDDQTYDITGTINAIRGHVDRWRLIPDPTKWGVTPTTQRLLHHWRSHPFQGVRPFFCQIEAVETAIWLSEVAPAGTLAEKALLDTLRRASHDANPDLERIALKLATGAGKTTVMAMLIAWQTLNAVRHPQSQRFTRGFLIVAPGITIKDRLRVLHPNDRDSYYRSRELVPADMLPDLDRAKIVITNYHAFKLRERLTLAKGGRELLQGHGPALDTQENEGQMLQRVMPELMGMKNILVINDEAHHCYREKPQNTDLADLKGEERKAAEEANEAARLWISGLETLKRKLGLRGVFDLSATPFFLRGSGYIEGTLFPWTASDFSLMDAIECGIVKLPRVPVADNIPGAEVPKFRNLWAHIGKKMPKAGASKAKSLDPLSLPAELQTALDALYGHYATTFDLWQTAQIATPPVFIVVCNNTATSKLVHDYIAGFARTDDDGHVTSFHAGRLPLFRNFDEQGNRLPRPNTLLIDSQQLESGDALDANFRSLAADEIERFRREIVERSGHAAAAAALTDADLLREVMNTVGKAGRLGADIRCVVSVSMLTEGWDCNTVTHILGLRAFGTQLLCEQVVGRALRRQSYDLNEQGLFNPEYADIFGIPFDFTAAPVVVKPAPPRPTITVQAVSPDRDALEIAFPRVVGYRVDLPDERLAARFSNESALELTPDLVGPSVTRNEGIIGEGADLTVKHLADVRRATVLYHLTQHLLYRHFRDPGDDPKLHLFGQLKRITQQWLDGGYLRCRGGTHPAQLLYHEIADLACTRITAAISDATADTRAVKALLDPYTPRGSTAFVHFTTSKELRWRTDSRRCHIDWVICDSSWEAEFCRVVEAHPRVRAYVKNQGLGFEVPYLHGATPRTYLPDFIVLVDDGRPDPLHLVIEIKGLKGVEVADKVTTMRQSWVPGVNNLGSFGRWAFRQFENFYDIEADFARLLDGVLATQDQEPAP